MPEMIEELLLSLGGVVSRESREQTSVATRLDAKDIERLRRILISLLHATSATGNITTNSLRRDANQQLVLEIDLQDPSVCKRSAKGSRESRFYLNVGESPTFKDDLVALGVVVAELMVPPEKRPAIDKNYRESLATRLRKSPLDPRLRAMKHLVFNLLNCESRYESSSDFLRDAVGIVGFVARRQGLAIEKIGWWSIAIHSKKSAFIVAVVTLVAILFGLSMYFQVASRLEVAQEKARDLEEQIEKLKENVPPHPVHMRPGENVYRNSDLYLAFKDDPILLQDKTFQTLVIKDLINEKEGLYLRAMLKNMWTAAGVWWECVKLDSAEIDKRILATDEEVRKILHKWRAKTIEPSDYKIKIQDFSCPSDYEGYQIRITFVIQGDKDVHRLFRVKDGKLLPDPNNQTFDIKWKAGQDVAVCVEYWSNWKLHWDNLLDKRMNGELSLFKFAGLKTSAENTYGFVFEFGLESSIGPISSTKSGPLIDGLPEQPQSTLSPDSSSTSSPTGDRQSPTTEIN